MAKRIKIGDIIEVKTSKGFAYLQYTHKDSMLGNLIRIFKGIYTRPLDDLEILKNKEIQFSSFFPLQTAINKNIVKNVGNIEIREDLKNLPIFKSMVGFDKDTSKARSWEIWDGETLIERVYPPLSQEQKELPICEIINDMSLIYRIENAWTADQDFTI